MPIVDKESFIAGLQLGRRIKVLDAMRKTEPRPTETYLLTETGLDLLTENDEEIVIES